MVNHDLSSYNTFVSFNLGLNGVTVFLSFNHISLPPFSPVCFTNAHRHCAV